MKKNIIAGLITTLAILPSVVLAQNPVTNGFEYASKIGGGAFGSADLRDTIVQLVNVLLGFLGIIAVIIILWGGFKWMTAAGNEENVREARNVIVAGIIGLGIIIASYSIAWFAVRAFSYATSDGASSFGW